jgi:hypothetical protein
MQIVKVSEGFNLNATGGKTATDLFTPSNNEYLNSNFVASYQIVPSGAVSGSPGLLIEGSFDGDYWQRLTGTLNLNSVGTVVLCPYMRANVTTASSNSVTASVFLAF